MQDKVIILYNTVCQGNSLWGGVLWLIQAAQSK